MNQIIQVGELSKSYGNKKAVDQLTFSVLKGNVLGLLGANGAGKTTSLECMLGTKTKESGVVSILGMDPLKDRKRLFQRVGVQFQENHYQREILVGELCEETQALYQQVTDYSILLKKFGLDGKEKRAVKDLSGGERQRLFIVLALIPNPEILILDELTPGLDTRARKDVLNQLNRLKEQGMTMILTSHNLDEVEALCDQILILKEGKTVFYGTVKEAILSREFSSFEDAYLWFTDGEREVCEDENFSYDVKN